MLKLIVIGLVAAVAVGGGFLLLGGARNAEGPGQSTGQPAGTGAPIADEPNGPPATPVDAVVVGRRPMTQLLEISGSLRTDEDVEIGSRMTGKAVHVAVKEGDRVRRGQVLVRLDDRELRGQIARSRGLLAAARARLSQARNQSTWKNTQAKSEYDRTQAALTTANAKLQQAETSRKLIDVQTRLAVDTANSGVRVATERLSIVRDLTRRQELQQAELAIDQAEARLSQAKVDAENAGVMAERRRNLYKQDAIAKEEVDEAERRHKLALSNVKVAETEVAVAHQKMDLAREGSRPEEVRIAEGQLNAAQRNLEQARSDERKRDLAADEVASANAAVLQAQSAVAAAKAGLIQPSLSLDEIRAAEAQVQQARADIQVLETQLQDLTIRAPVDGVVSTRAVNVGEMVTQTAPLMQLVALDRVYLEALAPELEVGQLRAGARCDVTVDSIPGSTFPGSVREIIPVADASSRAFRVRIAVIAGGRKLPAGGFARATVEVGTRDGALVVRKDSVMTEAGDKFVWLIAPNPSGKGAIARRQIVKVGLVDAEYAEILDGLEFGRQVVSAGSPAIIEGTPISVGSAR